MLVEQLDGKQENAPYPTNLWGVANPNGQNNNSPFRQQFQSNLNTNGLGGSNGYPQNLRKIALINGTTNGAKTNNSGNKFLELAAFKNILIGKIKVATINDTFLQNTGGSGQTFSGRVTIPSFLSITVIDGATSRTNANPRGTMDVVQGGTFNTQGIIKDEFALELNSQVDSQEWRTYLKNHAFIPTVSALAFKNPNFDWSTALNRNLVCDPNNKEIYFDSYFAPISNEEHVMVTSENANWLIKELQGIQQAPSFPIELQGVATICLNTNTTYTFGDICKIPSAATWSVSGSLQIVSSTNHSVVVKGISSGTAWITAAFSNGQVVTKPIYIDQSVFGFSRGTYESEICDGIKYHKVPFTINSRFPTTVKIMYMYPKVSYTQIGNTITFDFLENYSGPFNVTATITSPCGGNFYESYDEHYISSCDERAGLRLNTTALKSTSYYTIYPNPSTDLVRIDLKDQDKKPKENAIIKTELYNLQGELKRNGKITNTIATMDLVGLPKGIYLLKIDIDGKTEGHQVIIE
jgi:hypothetical protein